MTTETEATEPTEATEASEPAVVETKKAKGKAPTIESLALSAGKLYYFDPAIIQVEDGFNVRDMRVKANQDHLEKLTALIKADGITNPGRVRLENGKVILVSGHTRLLAALENIKNGNAVTFPAIVEPKGANELDRLYSLETDNSGKELEVLERAVLVARASKLGQTNTQIAARIGMSGAYVGGLLALASVPEKLKNYIRKERIAGTQVLNMLRENQFDGKKVLELVETAMTEDAANGGEGKITNKKLKGKGGSAAPKETEMYYKRSAMNEFIMFAIEIYENNSLGYLNKKGEMVKMTANSSIRKVAKGLCDEHGVNIQGWLEEMRESEAKAAAGDAE